MESLKVDFYEFDRRTAYTSQYGDHDHLDATIYLLEKLD
jgi:hypothetical protein